LPGNPFGPLAHCPLSGPENEHADSVPATILTRNKAFTGSR